MHMTHDKAVRVNLTISPGRLRALNDLAEAADMTRSAFIARLIDNARSTPLAKIAPKAPAVVAACDHDWPKSTTLLMLHCLKCGEAKLNPKGS